MTFVRNTWYVAGWSTEFSDDALLARTILGERLVFFRPNDGRVSALADRCPHRFAPLSYGNLADGTLECRYHGLRFDRTGHCVLNPHKDGANPSQALVKTYPIHERDSLVWIWMGSADAADPAQIPDFSFMTTTPQTAVHRGYLPVKANYQLLVDNIMDLSHVDFLHPTTLGGGALSRTKARIEELGDGRIHAAWSAPNEALPPLFRHSLPPEAKAATEFDVWTEVYWNAPSYMLLDIGATPSGEARNRGMNGLALHLMTPENDRQTHYFYSSARTTYLDDAEMTAATAAAIRRVFTEEDEWIIEGQQVVIDASKPEDLQHFWLRTDAAGSRVRRRMETLLKQDAI